MIDYDNCRKVLQEGGLECSAEEVKLISDFLYNLAQISVEHFIDQTKASFHEKCNLNGAGKL